MDCGLHHFSLKETRFLGEMVDSRSGAGNMKDEAGTSHHTRSKGATKDYKDCVKRFRNQPTGQTVMD